MTCPTTVFTRRAHARPVADVAPLIFNPESGGGRGRLLAHETTRLLDAEGVSVDPVATEGAGGARRLARRLAAGGAARILVLGGDGTASEAADGILASGRRAALGILPAGTGNDFLLHFGVEDLERAVGRIAAGARRTIDAVRIEHAGGVTHSINVFGVGFVADVCQLANRRLKRLGQKAYTVAAVAHLARLRANPTTVIHDGGTERAPFHLVAACTTRFTGGRMEIAPGARADDGFMDVVALRNVGRVRLVGLLRKVFDGAHMDDDAVWHVRSRRLRLELKRPSSLMVDGEVYGTTPVTLTTVPGALDVLV